MKNRYLNLLFFLGFDFASAILAMALSFLAAEMPILNQHFGIQNFSYVLWAVVFLLVSYLLKIYNILWRYAGFLQYLRIFGASVITLGILFVSQMAVFGTHFKLAVYIFTFFLVNTLIIAQRVVFKHIVHNTDDSAQPLPEDGAQMSGNIMLIGAGSAGEIIINEMTYKKEYSNCKIKCVIDDNPYKKGQYISGIKIVGARDMILWAAEKYDISYIIFAIPNCKPSDKSEILNICQKTGCTLRIVPSICKMYNPSELSSVIREVQIEDLLGRDPVEIDVNAILDYVSDKVVLVTGGGGTIGSELCRQIAVHNPKQLIIFDIYENNAYEIQNELRYKFPELDLVTLIGSVRDSKRLDYVFRTYRPNIVYHAAAHKHVPLMEDSPNETVKNNVFGTLKTAECADRYGVEKFLLISTDKAVNPTNIMGASKRICEMIIQTYNKHSETEFAAVRFGNVLGSNGSVIPLFKKQILHGGPVTVTDPNIIRYFMTIPEAVSLVLQAGATARGGEIFVLDMGEPVKILTLAENLIRLSGFVPYKDIKIEFTGLRPGEKLYEELLMSEEGLTATANNLIHIGKPIDIDEELFKETINEMKAVMYDETVDVKALVCKIVPTYTPENNKAAK
ncbi:MAG: polysaccharide biosynthesis protein [Clostridia bacterium]|nr:polysaccharide biosynthesis protein [Clostridia bacterium]